MDAGDPPSVPSASVRAAGRAPAGWQAVQLSPLGARVPSTCACCGETASSTSAVRRMSDGQELLVGYCAECLAHAGRDGTRTLAVTLASLLLALTLGAAWPLLGLTSSLAAHLGVVTGSALLPLLLSALVRPGPAPGHQAWGRAVAWSGKKLGCARRDYAQALVDDNPGARLAGVLSPPWFSPWMLAGPLLGLIGSVLVHDFYYPSLRVLNLSGERFELWIDGKRAAIIEPTSVESPAAGRELRLTAGPHRLGARTMDGKAISSVEVTLTSGRSHLYAPASSDYCFWLELRSYGRSGVRIERNPLIAENRFWVLPHGLDAWFTAPPEPGAGERTLSGGMVTSLRQGRCNQAPLVPE